MKFSPLALSFSFFVLTCVFSSAMAQVTVVDAGATTSAQSPQADAANNLNNNINASNNDIVMSLYLQLETLQLEVQALRGLVEEQNYKMRRMENEQRDRYLDMDGRLSGLSVSGNAVSVSGASSDPVVGTFVPITNTLNPGEDGYLLPAVISAPNLDEAETPVPKSEQELYRSALNLLLEESEYESSISLFQEYIDSHPAGRYITNAYYWQGEALILVKRFSQAKDVFIQVIKNFPGDPKAPGAMLKLGVAYKQLDDIELATQTWRNVSVEYPENTTEIRAAEEYLRKAESGL